MQSIAQNKTIVKYDRRRKCWQAINGTTQEFPAGEAGRQAAMLTALQHDHPKLFSLVNDLITMHGPNIALTNRLIRAAQLVSKGHVFKDGVKSQSGKQVYRVTFQVVYSCSCDDAQAGGVMTDYGPICKHGLAQLLAYLMGLDLNDYRPAPQAAELEPELLEIIDQGINDRRPDQNALPQWAGRNGDITDFLG